MYCVWDFHAVRWRITASNIYPFTVFYYDKKQLNSTEEQAGLSSLSLSGSVPA